MKTLDDVITKVNQLERRIQSRNKRLRQLIYRLEDDTERRFEEVIEELKGEISEAKSDVIDDFDQALLPYQLIEK